MKHTEILLPTQKRRLPPVCKIIYVMTFVSAVLYVAFTLHSGFADWFNRTVSPIGRAALASLTNLIPFSVGEWIIIVIPILLVLLISIAYRHFADTWRDSFLYIGMLFSGICVILILFVWNFAAGYYAPPLDQKLQIDRTEVSAEELGDTAEWLSDEIKALTDEIVFLPSGESLMPYSYTEMNQKLMDAYRKACEKYDFIDRFSSSVKPIMLSHPMSYTHVTGVYTFFTGEANLNVNFPDYTLPYTAAHELAHQRGVAREDEANFVAFLVCMESDDPYIRYSAYLNMYEYVAAALARTDPDRYRVLYQTLPYEVIAEQAAYRVFFEKYRENVAASVTQATNDTYLKAQGAKEGTRSYNMVVDLSVAYYRAYCKDETHP